MNGVEAPQELRKICSRNGLVLTDGQLEQLIRFVGELLRWNANVNLVSRRDQENIWFSHVLHSLALLFYIELPQGIRILDLGTGGGFPGIPIAIVRPDIQFVLLDSIRKKTAAVQDIVDRLGLTGVTVWTGRAEEIQRTHKAGGTFDVVLARAVASLRDLVRWSRPLLKPAHTPRPDTAGEKKQVLTGPALVALKGGDLEKEIEEARIKENIRQVSILQLAFEGGLELGLEDKKALIVRL